MLIKFGNASHILRILNVQLVPNLNENIISVRKFNAQYHTSFNLNTNNGSIYSRKTKVKIGMIRVTNELYKLSTRICCPIDLKYATIFTDQLLNYETPSNNTFNLGVTSSNVSSQRTSMNLISINDTHSRKINRCKLRKSRTNLTPEKIRLLESEGEIIHARFGHISPAYLNRLRTVATGLNEFIFNKTTEKCLICAKAKMTRKSFSKTRNDARHPCEIIHTNLISYSPSAIQTSDKYLLNVVDEYTRYLQVFPIKSKTQVYIYLNEALLHLKTMFYPQYPFRYLQSDNGPEFTNSEIQKILDKFDMQPRKSEPYEHEHNGLIERAQRTVEERVRALLFNSGFPSSYWGLAAKCATYIYNRTPHASLDFITPFEKVYSKPPDVSNIRVFGSRTAVHDPLVPQGNKTQARANLHYLVGFTSTGYLTIDPRTKKIHACCSVKINESIQYKHDYPNRYKDDLLVTPIDRTNTIDENLNDQSASLDTLDHLHTNENLTTSTNTNVENNLAPNSIITTDDNRVIENSTSNTNTADIPSISTNDSDSDYDLIETEIEEEIELDTDWGSDIHTKILTFLDF